MTPLEHMTRTLTRTGTRVWPSPARHRAEVSRPPHNDATGPTHALRRALEAGALPVRELSEASGVDARLIRGLLKADIDRGRVVVSLDARGHGVYALSPDFDAALHAKIEAARRLLTRHGYRVVAGKN